MRARVAGGVLVLAALGATLGYAGWRGEGVRYDSAVVSRGDVESSVSALGTLQPRRFVDVGAQVSGQVTTLHVQPGSPVSKGQLLVEIDPSVQQATVDASRAALAGLQAELDERQAVHRLAVLQHRRQRALSDVQATRDEDVQTAESNLAVAAARIDQLKAQIDQTQATLKADEARLGYTRIYAPMAGTVVSVDAREGQTLNATYQTPNILRIADLGTMTVWTEVAEADVRRVKAGMAVYFTTLGGDARRWQGQVRQVLPAPPTAEGRSAGTALAPSTSKVILYTVLFDVANDDSELMPQMTAQVSFVTAAARGALMVPLAAVRTDAAAPGQTRVRVLSPEGAAVPREVRLGVRNRLMAEVLEGVSEGERVVTGEHAAEDRPARFRL
ncbi:MAG: efflux RND transporter periplasmic adaptor subunit [Rhodocyclaceae bacterium]